jgi:lysozyme
MDLKTLSNNHSKPIRHVPPPPPPRFASPISTHLSNSKLLFRRRISSEGLQIIKKFEGLRLEAYICPAGIPAIGYNSTTNVKLGQKITTEEAELLLLKDLEPFEDAISSWVTVPLTTYQFSALVSFAFNIGGKKFKTSALLKFLNQGDYQAAADQFLQWDKVGQQPIPRLTLRRQAERALFLEV